MEEVPNLISTGPTNQILNQHEFFWRFCMCPSNDDTFNKNKKNLDVGTGTSQQRQEVN